MKLESSKLFCPKCKTKLDGFTSVSEDSVVPESGDVTICFYCSSVLEYINEDNELGLKEASYETMMEAGLLDISRAHNMINDIRNEN